MFRNNYYSKLFKSTYYIFTISLNSHNPLDPFRDICWRIGLISYLFIFTFKQIFVKNSVSFISNFTWTFQNVKQFILNLFLDSMVNQCCRRLTIRWTRLMNNSRVGLIQQNSVERNENYGLTQTSRFDHLPNN